MSVLHKRALTWWNEEKRTRGAEVALTMTWDQVKEIMKAGFCPRNEVKKLEDEFHTLAQDSGENLAYNTRFHELSLLLSHKVTPLSVAIEKYIGVYLCKFRLRYREGILPPWRKPNALRLLSPIIM